MTMIRNSSIPPRFLFYLLFLAISPIFSPTTKAEAAKREETVIPESARFSHSDIGGDRYELVGRLSLRRQFLGTRATPPFRDIVQFHFFNGDELKRSTFSDPELESRLVKRLMDGKSLPVVLTARFELKRIGHDGINMSEVLIPHIESFEAATAENICAAAEAGEFDEEDSKNFKSALTPGFEEDGISISLGKIYARSKVSPQGSPFSLHGIKVFNSTTKDVEVELVSVNIEQDGATQKGLTHERSRTPLKWHVKSKSWSDGIYEDGKMPGTLWMFSVPEPIKPDSKVTVRLEIKLDGNDPIILKRIVDPI